MKLACPECNQTLIVPDHLQGKQITCPGCKRKFMAPGTPVQPASDPAHPPEQAPAWTVDDMAPQPVGSDQDQMEPDSRTRQAATAPSPGNWAPQSASKPGVRHSQATKDLQQCPSCAVKWAKNTLECPECHYNVLAGVCLRPPEKPVKVRETVQLVKVVIWIIILLGIGTLFYFKWQDIKRLPERFQTPSAPSTPAQ